MVNSTLSRNRAGPALGVSLAFLLVALFAPKSESYETLRILVLAVTLVTTVSCALWLGFWLNDRKRYVRLRAGQGVIARWTVDPAQWALFRGLSEEWDKRKGVRPNCVNLKQTPGSQGIEIVVTGDCILIGDDFFAIDTGVVITVRGAWMELTQVIHRPNGSAWHLVLRIPFSPSAAQLGAQIQDHYKRVRLASSWTARKTLSILSLVVVGLPVLGALIAGWLTGWGR